MKFNLPRLIRSRGLTNTCQDNVSLLASHLQADAAKALLFDDLVGTSKKRRLHYQTERFRGLEIDDEVKFDGLLDR